MPTYYSEKKYEGPEAIVVAMDIGTTQSAVSFAHFTPDIHPEAQMTPSIVSYRGGKVKACGAEALQDFEENKEDVAYWFKVTAYPTVSKPSSCDSKADLRLKLHLHPSIVSSPSSNSRPSELPPLPAGVTIERVYADLMRYLMGCTQRFFERTTPNGAEIWARIRDTIVIVLATPNEWDIREQATLRKAAIRAELVAEESAGQLLQFVTEAEASVHYVLAHRQGDWLRRKTVFSVIDCGGSTVDTTIYRCVSTRPLGLNEACRSECVQTGGVFVDREAWKMLERKLKGSSFSNPEIIQRMVDVFEREVKPMFNGSTEEYKLRFGAINDNDASLAIHKGMITLSMEDLKQVFDPVINQIVTRCSSVIFSQKTEYVLIVGGFGESPYLQKVLSERLTDGDRDMQIVLVGDSVKKAAAEGAIIGHIKQLVVARVARATFGGCVRQRYEKRLHRERRHAVQLYADGKGRVDGVFHVWIKKGTILHSTFAHKLPYHVAWDAASTSKSKLHDNLKSVGIEVFAWESDDIPIWCKDERAAVMKGMRLICTLNADLSALAGALQITTGSRGERFYQVDYNVCVYFGGTQLRAKLQWKERGVLREGPVTVMPYVS